MTDPESMGMLAARELNEQVFRYNNRSMTDVQESHEEDPEGIEA